MTRANSASRSRGGGRPTSIVTSSRVDGAACGRRVVVGDGERPAVPHGQERAVGRPGQGDRGVETPPTDLGTVGVERHLHLPVDQLALGDEHPGVGRQLRAYGVGNCAGDAPGERTVDREPRPARAPVALLAQHDRYVPGDRLAERGDHPEAAGEVGSDGFVHLVAGSEAEPRLPRAPRGQHVGKAMVAPVVDREHVVALGLRVPIRDEVAQALRMVRREVVHLGGVAADVEERPRVGGEVVAALDAVALGRGELVHVVGDGLPAVVVDGPAPPALVVLAGANLAGSCVAQHRDEADAVDRHAGPVGYAGELEPAEVEDRRRDVDRVAVLGAQTTGLGDTRRDDDHRVAHSPFERVALPPSERGVGREGPAPRVVAVRTEPAEVVEVRELVVEVVGDVRDVVAQLVVAAVGPTLARRAVVGHEHHDGAIQLAGGLEVVDEAAEVVVRMGDVRRADLHHPCVQPAPLGIDLVPRLDPGWPFREWGIGRHDAERALALQGRGTPLVPTAVEATAEALDPLGRRLVRRVRCG